MLNLTKRFTIRKITQYLNYFAGDGQGKIWQVNKTTRKLNGIMKAPSTTVILNQGAGAP